MLIRLQNILFNIIFPWHRRGNKILLYDIDGKVTETFFIKGLTVRFRGKNSILKIYRPFNFKKRLLINRSKIRINGDFNEIHICETNNSIANLKIFNVGSHNNIFIGKNFFQTGLCKIDFCNLDKKILHIGNNCMFGQDIEIMMGDWHTIIDKSTNQPINIPQRGIFIGNNVWLARNVKILKDVSLANNTIVGLGSIVTKEFKEENTILAGVPAIKVKENVVWKK